MTTSSLHPPEGPDEGYEQENPQLMNAADRSEITARPPKRSNPPIAGHTLLHEGHTGFTYRQDSVGMYAKVPWGGCSCGARPAGFPDISINGMKRWHRQHKAELRGEA